MSTPYEAYEARLGDVADSWSAPGTSWTRGNHAKILVDGETYFRRWFEHVGAARDHGPGAEIVHLAWRLDDVTHGQLSDEPTTFDVLNEAKEAGVDVTTRLSGHGFGFATRGTHRSLVRRQTGTVYVDAAPRFRHVLSAVITYLRTRQAGALSSLAASSHTKLTVIRTPAEAVCLLGSIDLSRTRWDFHGHPPDRVERYPSHRGASHDVGVELRGPIVDAILQQVSRPAPLHDESVNGAQEIAGATPVAILQTLRADTGPRQSIRDFYLHATTRAQAYIYLEDQFFCPNFLITERSRRDISPDDDLLTGLCRALRRGVSVVVMAPFTRSPWSLLVRARDDAITALREVGREPGSGSFVAAHLGRVPSPGGTYVHSKLLLCDDEVVVVGSANVNRRSMFFDEELAVAVADPHVALAARHRLWAEHFALEPDDSPIRHVISALKDRLDRQQCPAQRFERTRHHSFTYTADVFDGIFDPYA